MAVPTWLFWTAQGFQMFMGIIITAFVSWYAYQRGSGAWGGGKDFFDFTPLRNGGNKLRKLKVFKRGPFYLHDKGGGEGVMHRKIGMFKEEQLTVRTGDVIPVGDVIFYDRKGIESALDVHIKDQHQEIVDMRNRLSYVKNELQKETHDKEELVDYITEQLAKSAKAVNFGNYKKGRK